MVSLRSIQDRREEILQIAAKHGARNVRVFGSLVRGEANETSDLDLLVRLDKERSLLDHIGLIQDLEDLLACKVDVVEEDALHQAIREQVLSEAKAL